MDVAEFLLDLIEFKIQVSSVSIVKKVYLSSILKHYALYNGGVSQKQEIRCISINPYCKLVHAFACF